ncbi:E3 SUMO-protein ligase ZBED1-like [Macrobrachium rosenbergii]|uniref:E3 SUMO-protein ligase ZBED1-like n=1 Tax=Macrobrachium rosenbergii TaxID=79674 RepID=UPI0034D4DAD9
MASPKDSGTRSHFKLPHLLAHSSQSARSVIVVTSNLHKHMKKHNASYERRARARGNTTESPGTSQSTIEDFITVSDPKKYGAHDARQKQQDNALVLIVACNLVPFSVVESPYFNGLLNSADPCYQMPTHKHLSQQIATRQILTGEGKCSKKSRECKNHMPNT